MSRRRGPTASSNVDLDTWLRVGCRKVLPAHEALLAFRALRYPRSKETAAAEKQPSRRVVAAMPKCRSEGSKCERLGRGGRRNTFDVSKERVLVKAVRLKNGELDVDTSHEIENPGSWLQVTRLVRDTEMFRFGSLPVSRDSVSSAVDMGAKIFKGLIPPTFQPIDGGASEVFFGKGYSGTHTDGRHALGC